MQLIMSMIVFNKNIKIPGNKSNLKTNVIHLKYQHITNKISNLIINTIDIIKYQIYN